MVHCPKFLWKDILKKSHPFHCNFMILWLKRSSQREDILESYVILFSGVNHHEFYCIHCCFWIPKGFLQPKGPPCIFGWGPDSLSLRHWFSQDVLCVTHRYFEWVSCTFWGWDLNGILLYVECNSCPVRKIKLWGLYYPNVLLVSPPDSKLAPLQMLSLFFKT